MFAKALLKSCGENISGNQGLSHCLMAEKARKPCFMIGAEGGWSTEEFNLMQDLPEICLAQRQKINTKSQKN